MANKKKASESDWYGEWADTNFLAQDFERRPHDESVEEEVNHQVEGDIEGGTDADVILQMYSDLIEQEYTRDDAILMIAKEMLPIKFDMDYWVEKINEVLEYLETTGFESTGKDELEFEEEETRQWQGEKSGWGIGRGTPPDFENASNNADTWSSEQMKSGF